MKVIAAIPARYAATRFPAKLMQLLDHQPVIVHTYQNTKATRLFDDVLIITDSDLIFHEIVSNGGKAIMSKQPHESGTDRIAEAVEFADADIIINVQGDEPFVKKQPLEELIQVMKDPAVQVGSLMHRITDEQMIPDPNCVKVVVDSFMNALYFSRSVIPYNRDVTNHITYYKHIGIYGYKKETLLRFTKLKPSVLEQAEKLEQLRLLENGIPIKMVLTDPWSISIDTPQDLEKAKKLI
jgi:3-deoxy-manno-octulosonate cytidylyltransferase (CMP-KDO synthetase)